MDAFDFFVQMGLMGQPLYCLVKNAKNFTDKILTNV